MLTVSGLYIYPVKSLGGFEVARGQVTATGLEHDRRWMLVDANNQFISQREIAAMALLQVSLLQNGLLVTHKQNQSTVVAPFEPQGGPPVTVQVWGDSCKALPVSAEADEWFSDMLSTRCRLVYMPDNSKRRVDTRYAFNKEITSFSDGFPFLLLGQASLDDLNSRLAEPLPFNRFRPNIVFTGGQPYQEDVMEHFIINGISFFGVKLCARCVITTINQQTAAKAKEPLKTLSGYRMRNNRIYFGQNLLHSGEGFIAKGDAVSIVKLKF